MSGAPSAGAACTAFAASTVAIVEPASAAGALADRLPATVEALAALGLRCLAPAPLPPVAPDGLAAGAAHARAARLRDALRDPDVDCLWATRGMYGCTELVDELLRAPLEVAGAKRFVGYSDVSFLGVWLSLRHPNLVYVHASNLLDPALFRGERADLATLFELVQGRAPAPDSFLGEVAGAGFPACSGPVIPVNLTMLESLCCLPGLALPVGALLFVEEVEEPLHRMLRKLDNLIHSGFLANALALVVGELAGCTDGDGMPLAPLVFARHVERKTGLPAAALPIFGHGQRRVPLVCGARATIRASGARCVAQIGFEKTV